jgi:secondary thiamine-phosphate synthase enzyme
VIKIRTKKLSEKTSGFCDITTKLKSRLEEEKIEHGQVTILVAGSTAALTTNEYEAGLVQDLQDLVEKLIPSDKSYRHDDRWGDDNGFSHLRASFFGSSLAIPGENGASARHLAASYFTGFSATSHAPAKLLSSS